MEFLLFFDVIIPLCPIAVVLSLLQLMYEYIYNAGHWVVAQLRSSLGGSRATVAPTKLDLRLITASMLTTQKLMR